MHSFTHTSLVASSILSMMCMCHSASVPKMRDLAGRQGLPMTRRAGVGSPTSLGNVDNVAVSRKPFHDAEQCSDDHKYV